MTSQDTLNNAQSEEEKAKVIQAEIDKEQSDIIALQKDINQKNAVISGLQPKLQEHLKNAQNLRQKAVQEQKEEQEEQIRQEEIGRDNLKRQAAKERIKRGIFG